ncbi:hypothetical protein VM1G_03687 [Cytospora mali]|uniref:Uncharacterized protein n=1 Tax=Cytospora mali TaxID=578113 RepID=A0A194VXL0_CYTMA|nr:hypothetical protein VM1G_03687 [Valsa mali]
MSAQPSVFHSFWNRELLFYRRTDPSAMPSQRPPRDPFGGFDQGRRQPQDTPDESPTEESETMDTDQDTENFLAYRQHRYGRDRYSGRHLLFQVGHGEVEGLPWNWFFEAEPLGIVRRGAIAADIYDSRRNADYPPEPRTASERARAMGIFPEPIRSIWKPIFQRPISPLSKRTKADDRAIAAAICSRIGEAMGWEPVQYIIEDDTPAVPEIEAQVPSTQDTTTQGPSQVENNSAPSSPAPRATGVGETRASRLRAEAARAAATQNQVRGTQRPSRRNAMGGSWLTSTQRTTDTQRRNVQGNNARGSDGSAVFSAVVESRLEDACEAGTSEPGTSASEESPERGRGVVGREDPQLVSADFEQLSLEEVVSPPSEPLASGPVNANTVLQRARNTNVTVGWEIEFLVPLAKGDVPSEVLEDGRYPISEEEQSGHVMSEGIQARAHIAKLLREARIPTIHADLHDPVQVSIAAAYLPNPEALDVSDEQQLQRGLRAPRGSRTALNMKLVGRDQYTFEFRHFQSSLDAVVIRQWTRVCLALVMAAKGLGVDRQHPASQVYDVFLPGQPSA